MNKKYFDLNSSDHWNSIQCWIWPHKLTREQWDAAIQGNPFTRPLTPREPQIDYTSSSYQSWFIIGIDWSK